MTTLATGKVPWDLVAPHLPAARHGPWPRTWWRPSRPPTGEEALNRAAAAYTEAVAFQQPPYTNSLEFYEYLKREVPEEQGTLLADLFEHIILGSRTPAGDDSRPYW